MLVAAQRDYLAATDRKALGVFLRNVFGSFNAQRLKNTNLSVDSIWITGTRNCVLLGAKYAFFDANWTSDDRTTHIHTCRLS